MLKLLVTTLKETMNKHGFNLKLWTFNREYAFEFPILSFMTINICFTLMDSASASASKMTRVLEKIMTTGEYHKLNSGLK